MAYGRWTFKVQLQTLERHVKSLRERLRLGHAARTVRPNLRHRAILASSLDAVGQCTKDVVSGVRDSHG